MGVMLPCQEGTWSLQLRPPKKVQPGPRLLSSCCVADGMVGVVSQPPVTSKPAAAALGFGLSLGSRLQGVLQTSPNSEVPRIFLLGQNHCCHCASGSEGVRGGGGVN